MATTIPGGYYIGTDGKPHDAHGNPLPVRDVVETPPTVALPAADFSEPPPKPAKARK